MTPGALARARAGPRSPRWADGWVLAAGASVLLGFAPFSHWYWLPVPMLVLFLACQHGSVARAAWRGWLFGLGQFAAGIFWIAESFQYNFISYPLAVLATSVLIGVLALYPALAMGLARAAFGKAGWRWPSLLGYPVLWALVEWLRGTAFSGFGWLSLGVAQIDGPLAGWLPLIGTYGVSALVAGVAALILGLCRPRERRFLALPLVVAAVLALATLAVFDRSWTQPIGPALSVALVQGNVSQADKWKPENRLPTLRRYLELSQPYWGAALVVWPETAVPGRLREMRSFLSSLASESGGSELLLGIPRLQRQTGRPLNSVVKVGGPDDGALYDKRHLVPFGEFLPFEAQLRPWVERLGIPVANFVPGASVQAPITVAGYPVGVSICYEAAFSREMLRALPSAAFMVNVSNDAWFGASIGPHQHLQLARVRARETGRWLARATNTGITAVIDAAGGVRARLPQFSEAALLADVVPVQGVTPLWRIGHHGVGALLMLIVAPAFASVWRRRGADARSGVKEQT